MKFAIMTDTIGIDRWRAWYDEWGVAGIKPDGQLVCVNA